MQNSILKKEQNKKSQQREDNLKPAPSQEYIG